MEPGVPETTLGELRTNHNHARNPIRKYGVRIFIWQVNREKQFPFFWDIQKIEEKILLTIKKIKKVNPNLLFK